LKAGLLMGLESPSSRAERMARLLAIWGRVPDVAEAVAKIDAVTLADVRAMPGLVAGEIGAGALWPGGRARGWRRSAQGWPPDARACAARSDRDRADDAAPAAACRLPRLGGACARKAPPS
jgi:hypothetical protein